MYSQELQHKGENDTLGKREQMVAKGLALCPSTSRKPLSTLSFNTLLEFCISFFVCKMVITSMVKSHAAMSAR